MPDVTTMAAIDDTEGHHGRQYELYVQIREYIETHSIPLSKKWDVAVYETINAYLQTRKPAEQLQSLRQLLEELRTTLERQFSIADVLMEVGDRRLFEHGW